MSRIKPIRNENEYQAALRELEEIFHAPKGTPAYDKAELLEILIENY